MDLKRWFAFAAVGFFFSGCFGGDLSEKTLGLKLDLQRHELSNGLKIVMIEDHTVPIVSFQVWINAGSVDEQPGITGISHFFEHLMFKGTSKYGPKQFFEQLESKGAEVNAYTTRDYTVYHETFVPELLEKVIDMESDRMRNLILDSKTFEVERQVVFEERRMRTENSPDGKMQEALWRLAFKRHPYGWPTIGTPEDLASITVEQLRAYYDLHYQPNNAVVVVVGDHSPEKTYAWIKQYYGPIPKGEKENPRSARAIPAEFPQNEERVMTLADPGAGKRFLLGYRVPSGLEEDAYALDVLANILFEGTSSRAYDRLVEQKGLALGLSGSNFTPTYPGLLLVSGVLNSQKSFSLLDDELEGVLTEVQSNGVTDAEVKRAVRQLTVQLVDSVRTSHGLAQFVGLVTTVFGDPYRFVRDLAKYTRVSAGDVQRVAKKYLIRNNRSVVVTEASVASGAKK